MNILFVWKLLFPWFQQIEFFTRFKNSVYTCYFSCYTMRVALHTIKGPAPERITLCICISYKVTWAHVSSPSIFCGSPLYARAHVPPHRPWVCPLPTTDPSGRGCGSEEVIKINELSDWCWQRLVPVGGSLFTVGGCGCGTYSCSFRSGISGIHVMAGPSGSRLMTFRRRRCCIMAGGGSDGSTGQPHPRIPGKGTFKDFYGGLCV
jgi:hypothetical protein